MAVNIEILKIYTLSSDGASYAEFLVGGEPVELVEYSYVSERMGSTTLSGTLRHARCLDALWTGREFVVLDEGALRSLGVSAVEKFFLSHTPSSSKSNEDARYVHSLEFRAMRDILLSGVYFCDAVSPGAASAGRYVGNGYEVKFVGTLDDFVERFNDVLSFRGLSSRFSVSLESGVAGTTESKEIQFSKATLADALRQAVEVWEVPFYFLGDAAVFGRADDVPLTVVEYGVDRELLSVSMNNRGEKIVTRIIGEGGTQNVPYYYPNPSPKGTLGVGGTAAGVTIRDMVKFSQRVGSGDVLTYEGKDASFGGVTLHFGGFTATSVSQGVTAVVDGTDHYGVDVHGGVSPFDVQVSADLSQGFDRSLDVYLTALLGSAEGISPDTVLWYEKSATERVSRLRGDVSAKGWSLSVERVEVVAGGVSRQVEYEGLYEEAEYDAEDAGLYPPRRLYAVRVDMGAAVSDLPSGTPLTSCQVRITGTLRSAVTWRIYSGQTWSFADFHVASFSASADFDPAGWYLGDECIGQDLSEVGLSQSGDPVTGTTVTQTILGYVAPTGRLMPGVYRGSGGTVRWYDADNTPTGDYAQAYVNPDTGENYVFENEYDPLEPHEHVETFEDVFPSIRNLKDGQGNPLNVLNDVYFDDGYNVRDLLPDGETLKYNHFFVKLKPLGFNLFDCAIEDGAMAVVMSDGPCAGCHFKIMVTSTGENPVQKNNNGTLKKEDGAGVIDPGNPQPSQQDTTSNAVWVALYLDDTTFGGGEYGTMPAYDKAANAGPRPVAGNAYTLENILLPQAFFTAAEQELDRRMVRFMWENNAEKFDPSVVFSRIYLAQHPQVRASLSERSRLSLTYDGRTYAPLYVSQFTLNVKEGEPLPEILVETEDVVEPRTAGLDEKISAAVGAAVNVIQGSGGDATLEQTDRRYLRKDAEDRAAEKIVFGKGLEVGDYRAGLGGLGGSIRTNAAGEAIAEFDFLNVRRKATFSQVEVEQIRKVDGTILLSLADIAVNAVERVSGGWKCWFKTDAGDGSAIENAFAVGDQAICRKLQSNDDHYYWRLVTAVGADWIVLSETDCDAGSDEPRVGDTVVQLGNRTDAARQSAQILSCYGEDSPSYVIYAGINSYSLAGRDISGFVYRETAPGSGTYRPHFFNYGSMYLGGTGQNDDYVQFTPGSGMTIKANVVFKAGQVIPGLSDLQDEIDGLSDDVDTLDYLKTALPESSTIVSGGLILSKVIALRDANDVIKSGINGDPSLSSIAAWYGGPMADKEATPTPAQYAQSLFRFDGTGYLAGGNITWNADGSGSVAGGNLSWDRNGVPTIAGGISIGNSGSTLNDILTALQNLPNTYVDFTSAQTISGFKTFTGGIQIGGAVLTWVEGTGGAEGYLRISKAIVTLGDQVVGSGTPGGGGGGGGGVTSLYLLDDVSVSSRTNGDLLQYNGTVWVNTNPRQLPVATANANGLMSSSDYSKLSGIAANATRVVESTVSGWGFTKNAGTVTSVKVGNTSYNPTGGVVSLPEYPVIPSTYAWSAITDTPTTLSGYGISDAVRFNKTTPPADVNTPDSGTPCIHIIHSGMGTTDNYTPGVYGLFADFAVAAGHLQFGTNTTQNEVYVRSYWWATRPSDATPFSGYPAWVKLYHSANLTKSVLVGLLEGGNGYYVKKSGDGMSGALIFARNIGIYGKDSGENARLLLYLNTNNHLVIGNGLKDVQTGGNTYLRGIELHLQTAARAGAYGDRVIVNSSGNVTVGASDLAENSYKLYVNGAAKVTGQFYLGTSSVSSFNFVRGSANYFTAPADGYFAFVPNGLTSGTSNSPLVITAGSIYPGAETDLGRSSSYWHYAYVNRVYLANGAYLEYNSTNGYIYISKPIVTAGDQ